MTRSTQIEVSTNCQYPNSFCIVFQEDGCGSCWGVKTRLHVRFTILSIPLKPNLYLQIDPPESLVVQYWISVCVCVQIGAHQCRASPSRNLASHEPNFYCEGRDPLLKHWYIMSILTFLALTNEIRTRMIQNFGSKLIFMMVGELLYTKKQYIHTLLFNKIKNIIDI